MQVIVNGTPRELSEGATLQELLSDLKLAPEATVVELNLSIVEKQAIPGIVLKEGDRLELVRIVGGG
jgi:thiamine biosynthesis protein ThiS